VKRGKVKVELMTLPFTEGNREMPLPSLTVVLVTQNAQNRIPRLLDALAKQTLAAELEVFIVYIAPANPAPVLPDGLRVIPINQIDIRNMGQARAEAVRRAKSPLVAFLEDHTIPNPGWAEAVSASFREYPEADAVSYAFLNGSPDTYFYRSVFMAEYGALAHPLRKGMAPAMAANNVAYRRDTLRKLGDGLDSLLEIDYFLQKALGRGFRTATAPRALLAHQTNRHLGDLLRGHFIYAQLFEQQPQRLLPHAARNCGAALAREVRCRNSLPLPRADGCSKERISLENGCGALHPVKTSPEGRAVRDLLQYHPCGLKKIIRKRISGYMRRCAGKFPPAGAMRTAAIGNPHRISACIDFSVSAASRLSMGGCSADIGKTVAGSRLG